MLRQYVGIPTPEVCKLVHPANGARAGPNQCSFLGVGKNILQEAVKGAKIECTPRRAVLVPPIVAAGLAYLLDVRDDGAVTRAGVQATAGN